MRLWIFQSRIWWDAIQENGWIRGAWQFVEPGMVENAYRWMSSTMYEMGVGDGSTPPVWAWHSFGSRGRKPSIRRFPKSELECLLEIEAPDRLVVLSDEVSWVSGPMNAMPLGVDEDDQERLLQLFEAGELPEDRVMDTWKNCLVTDTARSGSKRSEVFIQACLPHVELSWVRQVKFYNPRTRPLGRRALQRYD